ncbi:MAG: hypothetical protein ACTSYX_06970 [Candidatus Thorarchaeota archaeon]
MMSQQNRINITDLPKETIEAIVWSVVDHCVAIVHRGSLLATGTLVICAGRYGILTAYHVPHNRSQPFDFSIGSDDRVDLICDNRSDRGDLVTIRTQYLRCHDIGIPIKDEYGPDIAFLELPPGNELAALKAKKIFFNMDAHTRRRFAYCLDDENGFWAMAYCPAERTEKIIVNDTTLAIGTHGYVGFTRPIRRYESGGFDFIECPVDYTSYDDLPESFGGGSGGGLWKIPLKAAIVNDTMVFEPGMPVLAGILFYELPRCKGMRRIRCHGPKSIYQIARDSLAKTG